MSVGKGGLYNLQPILLETVELLNFHLKKELFIENLENIEFINSCRFHEE
jgi:hypothetical protein